LRIGMLLNAPISGTARLPDQATRAIYLPNV
jgi:hypothetical protein